MKDRLSELGIDLANTKFVEISPEDADEHLFDASAQELQNAINQTGKAYVFLLHMPGQKNTRLFYIPLLTRGYVEYRYYKDDEGNRKMFKDFTDAELKSYIEKAGYFVVDKDIQQKRKERAKMSRDLFDKGLLGGRSFGPEGYNEPKATRRHGYPQSKVDLIAKFYPVTEENWRGQFEKINKDFEEVGNKFESVKDEYTDIINDLDVNIDKSVEDKLNDKLHFLNFIHKDSGRKIKEAENAFWRSRWERWIDDPKFFQDKINSARYEVIYVNREVDKFKKTLEDIVKK